MSGYLNYYFLLKNHVDTKPKFTSEKLPREGSRIFMAAPSSKEYWPFDVLYKDSTFYFLSVSDDYGLYVKYVIPLESISSVYPLKWKYNSVDPANGTRLNDVAIPYYRYLFKYTADDDLLKKAEKAVQSFCNSIRDGNVDLSHAKVFNVGKIFYDDIVPDLGYAIKKP